MSTVDGQERRFRLQGVAADYYACESLEALCESGAGTGKTYSLLIKADACAWSNPNARILFVRRTRISMNTAPLPEWENEILWPGHPALSGPGATAHYKDRQFYRYPNGAEVWLTGFDSQEKIDDILSSKWDRVFIFQAEQMRLTDVEKLITRLRAFNTPYHQITYDVNPAPPEHWIAKRFGLIRGTGRWDVPPERSVFSYRHEDNPAWYDAVRDEWTSQGRQYVQTILESLTGLRRERLLKHRWVSAEGMVWEEFDADSHVLDGEVVPTGDGRAMLTAHGWERPVELRWFLGSVDIGFEDPAAFGCYGFDGQGRAYLIREEYRTHLTHDELADRIGAIYADYPMRAIVSDHDPAFIKSMNRWLSRYHGGRDVGAIVRSADKTRDKGEKSGLDIVRQRLRRREDGTRGLYFLSSALSDPDPELRHRSAPLSVTDEIPSYVYRVREDGKPYREEPDPLCVDHGCDQLRYMARYAWGRDLTAAPHERSIDEQMVAEVGSIDYAYERRHREEVAKLGKRPGRPGKW